MVQRIGTHATNDLGSRRFRPRYHVALPPHTSRPKTAASPASRAKRRRPDIRVVGGKRPGGGWMRAERPGSKRTVPAAPYAAAATDGGRMVVAAVVTAVVAVVAAVAAVAVAAAKARGCRAAGGWARSGKQAKAVRMLKKPKCPVQCTADRTPLTAVIRKTIGE